MDKTDSIKYQQILKANKKHEQAVLLAKWGITKY